MDSLVIFGKPFQSRLIVGTGKYKDGAQTAVSLSAMKHAVTAGRQGFLAGRMPCNLYAAASSPLEGISR
jgi:thiazole synthase ThiGH ThiG subunit